MTIRDYDPATGQAFQGDVAIIPMPKDIVIATTDEVKPVKGRLILQEGEVSGHHHALDLRQRSFRPATAEQADPVLHVRDTRLRKTFAGAGKKQIAPTARMYRDPLAVTALRERGIITREDLAVACLVIEGGPMVISHEEHDGIRVPPGHYLIGRQVESAGAEERVVAD